jgi:chaperonin GroEL
MANHDPRRMQDGMDALALAVASTLGPRTREFPIQKESGETVMAGDGVTVAREFTCSDQDEMAGARLLGGAALRTFDAVGDGTATAVTLAQAMLLAGRNQRAWDVDQNLLGRGMEQAIFSVSEALREMARPLHNTSELAAVAGSMAGIPLIGEVVADAMDKVGKDGTVTVEESDTGETTLDVTEGMQFDSGYLAPTFITDPEKQECVLENPYILIREQKISTADEIVPLLEKVAATGRPLLVVAETVEEQALATLVVNKMRGILLCCAVKSPSFGNNQRAALEDLAILTGGKCLGAEFALPLSAIAIEDLGSAGRVVVGEKSVVFGDGGGRSDHIRARCAQIRKQIETSASDYDREKLQERLCRLAGGVALIRMGGETMDERSRMTALVRRVLGTIQFALAHGVVPGGGVALFCAAPALDRLQTAGREAALGVEMVRQALDAPLRVIIKNAGGNSAAILEKMREAREPRRGILGTIFGGRPSEPLIYNALNGQLVAASKAGILDPVHVVRTALENAGKTVLEVLRS